MSILFHCTFPNDKQWLQCVKKKFSLHNVFTVKEKFDYENIPSMSDEEIRASVNSFFDKITPIVKQVEDKFLEHEDELLQLKNV